MCLERGQGMNPDQLGDVQTGFNSTANLKGKKCPPALAGLLVLQNTKSFSWLLFSPGRAVNSQQLGISHWVSLLGLHGFGRSWQENSLPLRWQNYFGSKSQTFLLCFPVKTAS